MPYFPRLKWWGWCLAALVAVGGTMGWLAWQAPNLAATMLVVPFRSTPPAQPPPGAEAVTYQGAGVTLQGWRKPAVEPRRGTLVYLHGLGDNRQSSAGLMQRLPPQGWEVIAYDSRGHGQSGGELCTYGVYEKEDLRRVLETVPPGRVVLLGSSLGAAVALQTAAVEPRVTGVIAAEVFSDLATVARERAPSQFSPAVVQRAFAVAEARAHFHIAEASPVAAAASIHVPVLLIHGMADVSTFPAHSERVLAALAGPKHLLRVPGAHHNETLNGAEVWQEIDRWLAELP